MSTPWTNEALHPSNARDRGFPTTYTLVQKLGVPECAQLPLASRAASQFEPSPLYVGNTSISSAKLDYQQNMLMTFNTGQDRVAYVIPELHQPFIAELYTHTCEGTTTHLAYMPKCQNLALMTPLAAPTAVTTDRWGDFPHSTTPTASVPEAPILLLFAIGLLILWYYVRMRP